MELIAWSKRSERKELWMQPCKCTRAMHQGRATGDYNQGNGVICMSKCRRSEEGMQWQLESE